MSDDSKVLTYIVGVVVIFAGAIALTLYAPCGWFMYGSVKDMPARCVGELVVPAIPAPGKEQEKTK